jgi:hypothetical protein
MMSGLNHSTGGPATFTTFVYNYNTLDVATITTDDADDENRF